MKTQDQINYHRIADAIEFIVENHGSQPELEQIAEQVHMSPFHFQRLFTEWAGVSPKKFLQYVSIEHAKQVLRKRVSLLETASEVGLSGTGRLHDLFVSIEGMTPGEFKNGGEQLNINYSFAETPFGNVIIASTPKGICRMTFYQKEDEALGSLVEQFPRAAFSQKVDILQQNALFIFQRDWSQLQQIKLHLKGTDFQLKVWQALLKVPMGELQTYGHLAAGIEKPGASRALGTAIGSNPVAFLIPCHRVIQSTGAIGGYRWGSTRKSAIIGWEAARMNSETQTGHT